ncbi:MAG: PAS domain S-box protein [Desulfococcaceae bacterium]
MAAQNLSAPMERQMCFCAGEDCQLGRKSFDQVPQLSDIIDVNAIQSMMDDFFSLTHIGVAILDLHGKILVATGWQDICTRFHRVHPEICKNCLESDIKLSNGIEPGTFRIYCCKNNMWDMATPIMVDGRRAGSLFLGQFLFADEEPDRETFRFQAQKYGFDEKEYLAALERVPRWTRETVSTVMSFYTKLAGMISDLGYSNVRLARMLKERDNVLCSLREKTEELDSYFSTALDLFCIADTYGYFRRVNPQWETALGYTVKELEGRRFFDFVHPDDLEATLQAVSQLKAQKQILNFTNRYRCKDGTFRWLEWRSFPHGEIIYAAARDITDHIRIEESLKQSEEKFRMAFRTSPDAINLNRASDGVYNEINEGFTKIMGYTREECIGKASLDLRIWENPEDRERLLAMLKKQGLVENMEAGFRRKDGNIRIGLMSACLLHINGEKIILSITRDITEYKKTQYALQESEKKFRNFAEQSLVGIYLMQDNAFRYVNPKFAEIFGYSVSEILNTKSFHDLAHPDDLPYVEEQIRRRLSGEVKSIRYKFRGIKKSGETIHIEVFGSSIFFREKPAVTGTLMDITERKHAEDALRESEKRYRLLFHNLSSGFALHEIILDEKGNPRDCRFLEVNPAFEKLTGLKADKLVGKTVLEVMPGIESYWIETYAKVATTGEARHFENYSRELDRYYAVTAYRPEPGRFATIFMDITDRKLAEQELNKLAEAVSQASEGIVITGTDGCIIYVNPAFSHITGYSREELIGKNPRIFKSGHQDAAFYRDMWEIILAGRRWSGRLVNKRKDSTLFTAECSIAPVKNQDGNIVNFVWITRDISKELELEKRVAQAQKMEAIGSLAGGIAHDFNNILFPIMGFSEMLLLDIPPENPAHDSIRQILTAAERARDLVKQILAFSRQSNPEKMPVRIQPVLKEVLKLSRATIPSNIEITNNIQKDCGLVSADPVQVHQIAMNLITNAYHAVEKKGGSIHMELKEREFGEEDRPGPMMKAGKYLCLTVSDTGTGIDKAIISKIFDPYFTTKPMGKGTGMGLSVVHGIVKEYGGDIRVYSEVGKGTAFHVYLPLLEEIKGERELHEIREYPTGSERIMLVDDEEQIVSMEQIILEKLGYRISAYTRSPDALAAFRADPGSFDLVITDMAMPDMTGDQVAMEMMRIRPDISLIICTGFSEKINADRAASMGIRGFLMKPVVTGELAGMVRKVLDEKKSGFRVYFPET